MRALVFANGVINRLPPDTAEPGAETLIIAADGGARHCRAWGLVPDVVIGDMDSLAPAEQEELLARGVKMIRHPAAKDETDLELALQLALKQGAGEIIILGALGQRWDMTLANVLILAASFLKEARIRLVEDETEIICLRGGQEAILNGRPGDTLSILPLSGEARGVTLKGLEYSLDDAVMPLGTTWGISNVFVGKTAEVKLREGLLLIVLVHQPNQD